MKKGQKCPETPENKGKTLIEKRNKKNAPFFSNGAFSTGTHSKIRA